jgi:uncharacterized protein
MIPGIVDSPASSSLQRLIMRFFLIHGSFGHPQENWLPWLRVELEKLGHEVIVPAFPCEDFSSFDARVKADPSTVAHNQNLENWFKVLEPYLANVDKNTVFVGHSAGPQFICRVLETVKTKVKASFFVAGFWGLTGEPTFDAVNRTFAEYPYDWSTISKRSDKFVLINADNDPYVPKDKSAALYLALQQTGADVKQITIPGGGHLNVEAGYAEFQELLELIKKLI